MYQLIAELSGYHTVSKL